MAPNKRLFVILPKSSETENALFNSFSHPKIMSSTMDKSIEFQILYKNRQMLQEYQTAEESGEFDQASAIEKKINEEIGKGDDLILKCLIDQDNNKFFTEIKDNYNESTLKLCSSFISILESLSPILQNLQVENDFNKYSTVILAAHLGSKSIVQYMDIQSAINNCFKNNKNLAQVKKVRFVYYSGQDNPANEYVHRHFPSYSYQTFVEQGTSDQFEKFLSLLEARSKDEEIVFFKTIKVKESINKLISVFLPLAIDCTGISECQSMGKDPTEYTKEAFEGVAFTDFLQKVWANGIESTLSELDGYSPEVSGQIEPRLRELKKSNSPGEFARKFNEFTELSSSIKASLI